MKGDIEILARGVCVRRGRVLLCHGKGSPNTYLPGGHVEFREAAGRSLEREIREELGLAARARRFLGAVEHTFLQKGRRKCELNLVFEVRIDGLDSVPSPLSREDYIEFLWAPLSRLRAAHLEPAPLCRLLPRWLKGAAGAGRWASTYGDGA